MKKQIVRMMMVILTGAALAIIVGVTVIVPAVVHAAPNTATGDIAGVPADLNDSAPFNLNTTTLGLAKVAFLPDGTQLTSGDSVPKGALVQFVIYIDNTTAVPVSDVSIQDVLDPTFVYQAGTMVVDSTLATGSAAGAIWSQLDTAGTPVTDAQAAGDVASFNGTDTIDFGNQNAGSNDQLDVPASSVWAVRITVKMQ